MGSSPPASSQTPPPPSPTAIPTMRSAWRSDPQL